MGNPEIDAQKHAQVIFFFLNLTSILFLTKAQKQMSRRKIIYEEMILEHLDIHRQTLNTNLSQTLYKN